MVAALGLLIPGSGALSLFGIGLTTATGSLTLAGTLVNALAVVALQSAFAPDAPTLPTPENVKANSKVSTGDRFWHFGRVKVGGNAAFHRAKSGVSYLLIVHGHGEIDGFESIELNSEPVSLDAQGFVVDGQYQYGGRSRVRILERLGVVPSAYYSEISAVWPEWTENHRLDGLSSTLMILESVPAAEDRRVYPNGDPTLTRVIRGEKLYDPRTLQREWSENAALVMARTIEHPDMFGRVDAVDWQDVSREADLADTATALSGGGNEELYRLSGSASLMSEPQEVLAAMMQATGSKAILKPDGKAAIRLGVWREPVLTLTVDDLLEIQELPGLPGIGEGYNTASVRYVDPDLDFTEVDAETYIDSARVAKDNGEFEVGLPPMLYSPSQRQTRLAAKIRMERENPPSRFRAFWRPHVAAALTEPFIRVDMPSLGVVGTFEVKAGAETFEAGGAVGVMLDLNEFRSSAMTLGIDDQGDKQTLPTADVSGGVPLVEGLNVVAGGVQTSQNSYTAGISVSWTSPASDSLTPTVQYKEVTSTSWKTVSVSEGGTDTQITGLIDGTAYNVRAAFVTSSGRVGDYTEFGTGVTALATVEVPLEPTGLIATDLTGGEASISATSSFSASNWKTQFFRDGAFVGEVVSPENTAVSIQDSPGAGTYNYTARAIGVSGTQSGIDAGPVAVTIT